MSFVRDKGHFISASTPRAVSQVNASLHQKHVGILRCPEALTTKQVNILRMLQPMLTPEFLRDFAVPIIMQKNRISLRALDWCVVNYCKQRGVILEHGHELIDVHNAYLVALAVRACFTLYIHLDILTRPVTRHIPPLPSRKIPALAAQELRPVSSSYSLLFHSRRRGARDDVRAAHFFDVGRAHGRVRLCGAQHRRH